MIVLERGEFRGEVVADLALLVPGDGDTRLAGPSAVPGVAREWYSVLDGVTLRIRLAYGARSRAWTLGLRTLAGAPVSLANVCIPGLDLLWPRPVGAGLPSGVLFVAGVGAGEGVREGPSELDSWGRTHDLWYRGRVD